MCVCDVLRQPKARCRGLILCLHDVCMKVLIIGGGDGGIARELDRYSAVKEVVLCEIDEVL